MCCFAVPCDALIVSNVSCDFLPDILAYGNYRTVSWAKDYEVMQNEYCIRVWH